MPGPALLPGLGLREHRMHRMRATARAAATAGRGGGHRPRRGAAQLAPERPAGRHGRPEEEHGAGEGDGPLQLPLQTALAHLGPLRDGQADRASQAPPGYEPGRALRLCSAGRPRFPHRTRARQHGGLRQGPLREPPLFARHPGRHQAGQQKSRVPDPGACGRGWALPGARRVPGSRGPGALLACPAREPQAALPAALGSVPSPVPRLHRCRRVGGHYQ